MSHLLDETLELQRLVLVALQLVAPEQRRTGGFPLERAFREVLPDAYRLVQLAKEFLDQKEAEHQAFLNTPEQHALRDARIAEFRKEYLE
jgi:hypothetical protein